MAPRAEECITYGVGAFRLDGHSIAGFGASAKHCAFYPMSGTIVEELRDKLVGYEVSKGTIRFRAADPLPPALVKELVRARLAEIERSRTRKSTRPRRRAR